MNKYQKKFGSRVAKYLKEYLTPELIKLNKSVSSLSNLKTAYRGLRSVFLTHFILVDLYEKEYPFVAKQLRRNIPLLVKLDGWHDLLINYIKQKQADGLCKIGANNIIKTKDQFYYFSKTEDLFEISDKQIVAYPPTLGKKINASAKKNIFKRIGRTVKFRATFQPETYLGNIETNLHQFLSKKYTSQGQEYNKFNKLSSTRYIVKTIADFENNFSFIFDGLSPNSKPLGYQAALKLCRHRAKKLSVNKKLDIYNKSFLENFSVEYEKRLRFLTLAILFVKDLNKNQKNIWLLRDQIEPYLLKKSLDVLCGTKKQNDKFIYVSRNSTSSRPGDHYAYSLLNSWYYQSLENSQTKTYKEFINCFYNLYLDEHKKNKTLRKISRQTMNHLFATKSVESIDKKQSLTFIDTGFQGTFNIFIEIILRQWAIKNHRNIGVQHRLMGVWPWLEKIFASQHLTTYFPIVLIVEYFDGLHELVKFDKIKNNEPYFKQAPERHQLPAFLDLILIHDTAIAAHHLFFDNQSKKLQLYFHQL